MQSLPSPPPEGGMAIDTAPEIVETQPAESQVVATQINSQEAIRRTDDHLWGYLIPCSPHLRRLDFIKTKREYKIGRNKQSGNDFVLPGMKVSNTHCIIRWDGREDRSSVVSIEDLSSNGTFINGDRLGKGRFDVLKEGNEIAFGANQPQPGSMEDYRYIYRHMAAGLPLDGVYAHYELVEELGKGSFATVMRAMSKATGLWYACKMIHVKQLRASVSGKIKDPAVALHKEVKILERLQHPNICQLKEVFYDDSYINIILELVPGGDLLDYILKRNGLPEDEAKHITYQLCDALAYIHSQGVAHRDLKPENVLLTKDVPPVVKVADFGLAKAVDSLTMLRTMCGTPSYLAPEVVTQGEQEGYQQIVDSWSVGVIVFSMITNTAPFIEPSHTSDIKLRIIQRTIDWSTLRNAHVSNEAVNFIENLLLEDPKMRMSLADALNHPWLLPLKLEKEPPAVREPTLSPRLRPVADVDVSMMEMSSNGVPSATPSPQNHIPGAYPASQPDRTLRRRRKAIDEAKEAGHLVEPSPEMIERASQQQTYSDDDDGDDDNDDNHNYVSRPLKRKARPEPSEAMVEDEPVANGSTSAQPDTPPGNVRSRKGKAPAIAASSATGSTRTRARAKNARANADNNAEDLLAAPARRSTRHAPTKGRK